MSGSLLDSREGSSQPAGTSLVTCAVGHIRALPRSKKHNVKTYYSEEMEGEGYLSDRVNKFKFCTVAT